VESGRTEAAKMPGAFTPSPPRRTGHGPRRLANELRGYISPCERGCGGKFLLHIKWTRRRSGTQSPRSGRNLAGHKGGADTAPTSRQISRRQKTASSSPKVYARWRARFWCRCGPERWFCSSGRPLWRRPGDGDTWRGMLGANSLRNADSSRL
jgi:hypothetical protein